MFLFLQAWTSYLTAQPILHLPLYTAGYSASTGLPDILLAYLVNEYAHATFDTTNLFGIVMFVVIPTFNYFGSFVAGLAYMTYKVITLLY